ncbi:MAG: DUF4010 domain-containing protein [Spirochaetota bacterium]
MLPDLFIKLILSIVFGATIGLERESSNPGDNTIGGIRTFSLIALAGALTGVLYSENYIPFAIVISAAFSILIISYYIIGSSSTKDYGLTSEISALITYLIGALLVLNIIPLRITIAIFIIIVFILSIKSRTTRLAEGISRNELHSFISYAIIALVVLPVLPDVSYRLKDIPILPEIMRELNIDLGQFNTLDLINPRKIWFVVVLITGIDVSGYILGRIVGNKRGFAVTSLIAGFVSSTSATQSLAQQSRKTNFINNLTGAAVLANMASFFQVILLIGPLNAKWLASIFPSILLMIISAGITAYLFLRLKEPQNEEAGEEKKQKKIFSLMPALKFAGILITVKIVTKICLILFGKSGFIISSVIASFAGIDAIMVNLAEMAGNTITFEFAFLNFILINATNLMSKTVYSYLQGSRQFAFKFMTSSIIIITASAIWLIFI